MHRKPKARGLATKAVETQAKGGSLATKAVGTQAKGGGLATKAVETQGNGSVFLTTAVETQAKGGGLATKALETKPKGISVCESKCLFRRENHPQNLQESWGIAVSFHVRRQNRARLLFACEKVLPDRRQDGGTI